MQRSTLLSLLLACTVCAVLAIVAFGGEADPVLPPGSGSGGPAAELPGENRGAGSDLGASGTAGASPGDPAASVPPGAPRVTVRVTEREQFVPPPDAAPPFAETVDGVPLPCRVVAGIGSGFDARRNKRGVALLSIGFDGRILLRQVAVDPQAPLAAKVGARVVVRGQVVDVEQKPVAGASVWFGESAQDGTRFESITDADGMFESEVPASQGVPMVVRASGRATTWRAITVEPRMGALKELLQPATTLKVLLAARAVAIESARAFLVPQGSMSTGLARWPFFAQALSDGFAFDEQGRAQIEGLPQGGSVGVVVVHPYAPLAAPKKVALASRPVQVIVPVAFASGRQRGVVVDESGRGIAASLWSDAAAARLDAARSLRLLPPHLDVRGACLARTAADGEFAIGLPVAAPAQGSRNDAMLVVRAQGHAGRTVAAALQEEQTIVLPRWLGGEPSLRILPPTTGEAWRVAINLGDGIAAGCEADRAFAISLPHAGRFDVEVLVEREGKPGHRRAVPGLSVTGVVDLPTAPEK